jgi:Flp pilus assembly protein TadG
MLLCSRSLRRFHCETPKPFACQEKPADGRNPALARSVRTAPHPRIAWHGPASRSPSPVQSRNRLFPVRPQFPASDVFIAAMSLFYGVILWTRQTFAIKTVDFQTWFFTAAIRRSGTDMGILRTAFRKAGAARRRASGSRIAFTRFRREEDGSIILFSLFLFVMMILIGGMAVDLMRFETRRVHMQNTLDSAMLAAADLTQTLDPEDVVNDYFAKAGYDSEDVNVTATEERLGGSELVGRRIEADTRVNVPTIFMHMLDVPLLSSPVASAATENIQNVEISLVLDISGSMRWGATDGTTVNANRITDLRSAVIGFAREVLQVECTGTGASEVCTQPESSATTTINIIPYAGHVNPGRDMFEILGGARWHNWSSCKEITNTDFGNADLPRGSGQQLPHFMVWAVDTTWMNWGWCPQDSAGILYAENDYEVIEDYINTIKLHDGTATHIGMKYGVALLNPSSRDEFATLADRGIIADEYRTRPANFDDDVVKYIVLMTDGRTTDQHRPRVPNDGRTDSSSDRRNWNYTDIYSQFLPDTGGLRNNPAVVLTGDGDPAGIPAGMTVTDNLGDILHRFGSVNRTLDGRVNAAGRAEVEYGYPTTTHFNDGSVTHNVSRNETNITAMCNLAKLPVVDSNGRTVKADRITVFTISFFAPDAARTLMENCASSPAHHFRIQNLNIDSAFQAIAKTINQLRLTL